MRAHLTLVLFLCVTLHAGEALAGLVLRDVILSGTGKTTRASALARMGLHRGDRIDLEALETARKRMAASGLFSSVEVFINMPRPHVVKLMYLEERVYSIDVHVKLEEKLSWFIVPNASFGAGDAAGGLIFVEQNLLGRDLKLALVGQLGQSKSYALVGFRDPIMSFAPMTYSIAGYVRFEDERFYEQHAKAFEVPTNQLGGELQVGWVFSQHLRALVGGKFSRITVKGPQEIDPELGLAPYNPSSGNDVVLELIMLYDDTTAPTGLRTGVKVGLRNEVSDHLWGSDFDYVKVDFQAELYGRFFGTYPSLVFHSEVSYPTSARGVPVTQLLHAGGADLRGYLVNEFHGDTLIIAQFEEQVPFVTNLRIPHVPLRLTVAGAAFVDTGALLERHPGGSAITTPDVRSPRFSDFHSSVGVGLRLLLPGITIPALKVDVGYGIDVSSFAVTISVAGGANL